MRNFRKLLYRISGISLVVFASMALTLGQQARNSLRGLVKDQLGAAIVGATVTLTDVNGVRKTTTTNDEGVYSFNGLAPGKYLVQAVATGFAPSEETEVGLALGQRQSLDLSLKVTIEEQ